MSIVPSSVFPGDPNLDTPPKPLANGETLIEHTHSPATTNIKGAIVSRIVLENNHVSVHYILDMNKISSLHSVLVHNQRQIARGTAEENPANPGILIEKRLPVALRDRISQSHGRYVMEPP